MTGYFLRPQAFEYRHGAYWPMGAPDLPPPLYDVALQHYRDRDKIVFAIAYVISERADYARKTKVYPMYLPQHMEWAGGEATQKCVPVARAVRAESRRAASKKGVSHVEGEEAQRTDAG